MALNPQYEAIGKAFTQQYYALFDDPAQRQQLTALYNVRNKTKSNPRTTFLRASFYKTTLIILVVSPG